QLALRRRPFGHPGAGDYRRRRGRQSFRGEAPRMKLSRAAFLGLSALTLAVFILLYGPLLVPIISSFFTVAHSDVQWDSPSFSSYGALAHNDGIIEAFLNTLIVGFSATFLSVVLGIVFAIHYCSGKSLAR